MKEIIEVTTADGLRLLAVIIAKETEKTFICLCQDRLIRVKLNNGKYNVIDILSEYCELV